MWAPTLACAVFIQCAACLRLVRLDVPYAIVNGDSIWLNCSFDLEADELYSVKWYKNNVEFYRYLPSDNPPAQTYDLLGVYLDLEKSLRGHVYLYKTDLNSEGTYRCEVSAEAPSFQTVREEREMRIYVVPEKSPTISGIHSYYGTDEEVNVTCIAGPSKPPTRIQWYINGRETQSQLLAPYTPRRYKNGLLSSRVGLKFKFKSVEYLDDILKLGCFAVFSQLRFVSSEEMIISSKPQTSGFKSVPGYGHDGPTISGGKWKYDLGDIVDLNCTFVMRPAPHLQWLINDLTAPPEYVTLYKTEEYNTIKSVLSLRLPFSQQLFANDSIRLNCTAKLFNVVTFRAEETILGNSQHTSGLQMSPNGGDVSNNGTRNRRLIILFLLFLQMSFS